VNRDRHIRSRACGSADTAADRADAGALAIVLDLPCREARDRLLAVHGILGTIRNNDYAQQTILGDIQSIVPGINNGPVDLQFLRATAADRQPH